MDDLRAADERRDGVGDLFAPSSAESDGGVAGSADGDDSETSAGIAGSPDSDEAPAAPRHRARRAPRVDGSVVFLFVLSAGAFFLPLGRPHIAV